MTHTHDRRQEAFAEIAKGLGVAFADAAAAIQRFVDVYNESLRKSRKERFDNPERQR